MTAKSVLVHVTAEDIAKGDIFSPKGCPVALALAREVGRAASVTRSRNERRQWVGAATFDLGLRMPVTVRLSQAVGEFTVRFDTGAPVKPFAFRVGL